MKHLGGFTTVFRPNVEGQAVFQRTQGGAVANFLYLRYISIGGKKGKWFLSNQRTSPEVPLKDSIMERLQVEVVSLLPFILLGSKLESEDLRKRVEHFH